MSVTVDRISRPRKLENGLIEVTYQYTLITETEFTIYLDNLPHEYSHKRIIRTAGRET